MPMDQSLRMVGDSPERLLEARLPSESTMEEMIVRQPSILSTEWLVIGQQEAIQYGVRIDLLGLALDRAVVLIELKKDKAPRDVAAQALDYAS